jgi:hypothetical protein
MVKAKPKSMLNKGSGKDGKTELNKGIGVKQNGLKAK